MVNRAAIAGGVHPSHAKVGAFDGAAIAAEIGSKSFVWGAPYFLGKRIALVFEGMGASGKMGQRGPFFAIK